jgi:hypothetical protein
MGKEPSYRSSNQHRTTFGPNSAATVHQENKGTNIMGNRAKSWPEQYTDWPANNSNAARDRDEAALSAAEIRHLARTTLDLVAGEKVTQQQLLYILARVEGRSSDILRLMERNGAPTRPT